MADSACSATAYLCGVKTDIDTIGIDYNVEYNNCDTQKVPEYQVDSVMDWAQVQFKKQNNYDFNEIMNLTEFRV